MNLLKTILSAAALAAATLAALPAAAAAPMAFREVPSSHGLCDPVVYCFAQDAEGYMWIGTRSGLNRYDGYRMNAYRHQPDDTLSLPHSRINSLTVTADGSLLVGTDCGWCVYDRRADRFVRMDVARGLSVKAIAEQGSRLWICTNHGLFAYDRATGRHRHFTKADAGNHFPGDYVPCALVLPDGRLAVGTHNKLCLMNGDRVTDVVETGGDINLVLSVMADADDPDKLWIGTEQGLMRYSIGARNKNYMLTGVPIKSMCADADGNLVLGTDNGLYVRQRNSLTFDIFRHRTDDSRTIPNDVVWSVAADRDRTLWLGTDNGIAIVDPHCRTDFASIKDLTGSTDGHQVFAIVTDNRNNLWLGGSNGLIMHNRTTGQSQWFRMDAGEGRQLLHNKVRCLYPDGGSMWIATDGGLNRYDYATGCIEGYALADSTGTYNSKWMYAIVADRRGRLWIATYEGGVFVVDKADLQASHGRPVTPVEHYSAESATHFVPDNIVNSIVADADTVWISTDNAGIRRIAPDSTLTLDTATGALPTNSIRCLTADLQGNLWIGTDMGLLVLTRGARTARQVAPGQITQPVRFVTCDADNVWVGTAGTVVRIDSRTHQPAGSPVSCGFCLSAYVSRTERRLYVGVTDGVFGMDIGTDDGTPQSAPQVTNLIVGSQPVAVGQKVGGLVPLVARLANGAHITLPHALGTFGIECSAFAYSAADETIYAYRLDDADTWVPLPAGHNQVVFSNLNHGDHTIAICTLGAGGRPVQPEARITVTVLPPWYLTTAAKTAYAATFVILVALIVLTVNKRQRMAIAELERTKTLKMAHMKLDFFANMSHEFKTPLSLIICNIGRLMAKTPPHRHHSDELKSIEQNVQKLHQLINKMLDSGRDGNDALMPSLTRPDEFLGEVFARFGHLFEDKGISAVIDCHCSHCHVNIDRVKMDSAISNLISNAVKFTPRGGSVVLRAAPLPGRDELGIELTDTGCGIPAADLPRIGERYFRSQHSAAINQQGTGLGMSMAMAIVRQHKGRLDIESEPGRGTTVRVVLPCEADAVPDMPAFPDFKQKPLAIVAEDNDELRRLMADEMSARFELVMCADGAEAFDQALTRRPDIVVTDLMMPGVDGYELCRRLRANINTALVPIVVLTALDDSHTELSLLEVADDFLTKPFDMQHLEKRMANLIVKSRTRVRRQVQQDIVTPDEPAPAVGPDEAFLSKVTAQIEASISDPDLNVSELCTRCGTSEKQLYRRLKQITGLTAVEFIRSIRLKKAAMYLSQGQLTVSEVMYMVGFSNHSYFTKCFKKEYGVVPKEYRESREEIS